MEYAILTNDTLNTVESEIRSSTIRNGILSEQELKEYAILTNDVSTKPHLNMTSDLRMVDAANHRNDTSTEVDDHEQPSTGSTVVADMKKSEDLTEHVKDSFNIIRVLCVWC